MEKKNQNQSLDKYEIMEELMNQHDAYCDTSFTSQDNIENGTGDYKIFVGGIPSSVKKKD